MHADAIADHAAARFADFTVRVLRLTQREREVLGLIVEGRPTSRSPRQLALSCKTVETHRAKLMSQDRRRIAGRADSLWPADARRAGG